LKEAEAAANKDKPSIKKGVTYQGIFQHYGREEIFEWAKDNGLKTSGNKPQLIKRIIAFLEGDKENTVAVPKEKKEKKEKKEAPKSPKKGKKTTEKKATKKDEKKEEKKEKKEEAEAEEEEEEEEKKEKKGTKESKKKN
jgi:outer membrane biosynthesis protein TonB